MKRICSRASWTILWTYLLDLFDYLNTYTTLSLRVPLRYRQFVRHICTPVVLNNIASINVSLCMLKIKIESSGMYKG